MDIPETAIGAWPNIAEPAGSDPREVMRKYGRKPPRVLDECRYVWSLASNGWVDWTCDKCGNVVNLDIHVEFDYNYCPKCGREVSK